MKQLRQNLGLSAFELAHLSGVSLSTINRMEAGKKPVSRLNVGRVLRVLNDHLKEPLEVKDLEGILISDR